MPAARRIVLAVGLSWVACDLCALEVERADTQFAAQRYSFELVATLDAPIDRVEAVLRDYAAYPSLDARILEAKVIERPAAGEVLLFTRMRACFGPVCRKVQRVERVVEATHELRATAIGGRSDVSFGETHTQISTAGKRTRVIYRTSMTPDFWIPRLIGRRLMLNTLRDATLTLFASVERQARTAPQDVAGRAPAVAPGTQ